MASTPQPAPEEKKGLLEQLTDLFEELNEIPWATLIVLVFAIAGAVGSIVGALTFQEYLERVLAAAAVLGVGRGVTAASSTAPQKKAERRLRRGRTTR